MLNANTNSRERIIKTFVISIILIILKWRTVDAIYIILNESQQVLNSDDSSVISDIFTRHQTHLILNINIYDILQITSWMLDQIKIKALLASCLSFLGMFSLVWIDGLRMMETVYSLKGKFAHIPEIESFLLCLERFPCIQE